MSTLELTSVEILGWVMQWLWPFFRVAGLVMTAPLIGTKSVPVRLRLALAFAVSLVIAPVVHVPVIGDVWSPLGLLVTVQQVLIGAALGLAVRMVFLVMEVGGQIIAQQTGLGFAAMVDPLNGAQVPVISQFYIVLGTVAFLNFDGHLLLFQVLGASFQTLPIGSTGLPRESLWQISQWVSWLIAQSVVLALPVIGALLVVNIALAVVARAAPQLSIINVGFPFMILFGMLVVLYTAQALEPIFARLFDEALTLARDFAGGP
jgi:flagellar biosynthesis protein FliR